MGACGGKSVLDSETLAAHQKTDKIINEGTTAKKERDVTVKKILLLGAGESGKSTFFKQLTCLYGEGFQEEEKKFYKNVVYDNVIGSMQLLGKFAQEHKECQVNAEVIKSLDFVMALDAAAKVTPEIARHVAVLWKDPGIQEAWNHRNEFQILESAPHFFAKVEEIGKISYVPDDQDILMARLRTTGVISAKFSMGGLTFNLVDVGGQRNERKRWIHQFENVSTVIFIAASSEYDQTLFEDNTVNRIQEALNLWEETLALSWFKKSAVILFLNKTDLFAEKIKTSPISKHFPEYTGGDNLDAGKQFFENLFRSKCVTRKDVFVHFTCVTNRDNVETVFNDIKQTMLRDSLADAGLQTS
jgi:guanine nucleotide-binding protein subunit alpha